MTNSGLVVRGVVIPQWQVRGLQLDHEGEGGAVANTRILEAEVVLEDLVTVILILILML